MIKLLDNLTGMPSRQALSDFLASREASAGECWLAVVDIDTLKNVNIELGHAIGDRYLIEIARQLGASDDIFPYRIAGDEFALIAIGMSLPCFIATLQTMQNAIHSANLPMPGHAVRKICTVSMAVATRALGEQPDKIAFLQQLRDHLDLTKHDGQQRYYEVFCEFGDGA